MKHDYLKDKLDNTISLSSARVDKLFKIKLWVWNNIIDTKHGWYWFVEDHIDDIDFNVNPKAKEYNDRVKKAREDLYDEVYNK